jgi:hypothetical protein
MPCPAREASAVALLTAITSRSLSRFLCKCR